MEDDKSKASGEMERSSKLPDEILGAHGTRSDFLKWKLLLVAALGGAAFGLEKASQPFHLLLALIPFVCIYVDLLCTTLKVRIIVIGTFYAQFRRDIYERYTGRNRQAFRMEDWALYYSTYGICFLVAAIGLLSKTFKELDFVWPREFSLLFIAGLIGTMLCGLVSFRLRVGPFKVSKGLIYLVFVVCFVSVLSGLFSETIGNVHFVPPQIEDVVLFIAGLTGFGLSLLTNFRSKWLLENLVAQTDTPEVQNAKLTGLLRANYTAADFKALRSFLTQKGVFIFKPLPNGLFSAAASAKAEDVSGYQHVWVRDNIHVAHAHLVCGDKKTAARTLETLMYYFQKYRRRFGDIIKDKAANPKSTLASDPMNRPHIRFDGRRLAEVKQDWAHAQNDALGYFLWCYCKLAREGLVKLGDSELEDLALFPLYFEAVEYWQDKDSGHWEEARKVSASSIGTVVAGLREFGTLMDQKRLWPAVAGHQLTRNRVDDLRKKGRDSLDEILPCESIKPDECYRRYDSALLFLIYPLDVLSWEQGQVILEDVRTHLQGDYGIRRYLGDSYWFPDYKKVPARKRTADYSESMGERDANIRLGQEAQWCIFDPIISVIYGRMHLIYQQMKLVKEANEFLLLQTAYFNRALGQLTGQSNGAPEFSAPEAYYLENGHYVPNDHAPLLWTQANLWLAVNQMQRSVESTSETDIGYYSI